jgi:selenocysteine-specific elongation factor
LRRNVPAILARLGVLAAAEAPAIVAGEILAAGEMGVAVARLVQLAGISAARVIALLGAEDMLVKSAGLAIARAAFAKVQAQALAILQARACTLPALAARMPHTNAAILEAATAQMVTAGRLRRDNAALQAPDPARDQARAASAAQAEHGLAEILRRAGLSPPEPEAIAPGPATRALVDRLVRRGVLVRAPDPAQGREIIFHYDAVSEARRVLARHLAPPGMLVREAGAVLGISRKYSVPLLEYLDAVKFTRRVADRRVLA